MRHKGYLFCLSFSILAGCAGIKLEDSIYILDDKLSVSYMNIDDALKYKRSKLLFSGEKKASDCNSYLALASKRSIEESIHNQQVKSEYLICDALKILSDASGVSAEKVKTIDLGDEILSKLDLRTFPSSLSRVGSDVSHTLKALYPNQTSYIDNVAELETEEWTFTVEVVALAKINDNSAPDWVVWVFDESKSGNYRGYSTIILYDPEESEVFRAEKYP